MPGTRPTVGLCCALSILLAACGMTSRPADAPEAAAPAPYADSKVMAGEQTVGVTLSVRYELER